MPSIPTALVNGEAVNHISIADRGLNYGDGLFETITAANGNPCLWQKHIARLLHGCNKLGIIFEDIDELENEVFSLAKLAVPHGVVKVTVTRGNSETGYRIPSPSKPSRIVQFQNRQTFSEQLYREGISACFCKQRLSRNRSLSKIKHLCRLDQVLARMEWQDEYHEGIMFDDLDNAIEGTMSNLFIVNESEKGLELKTPCLDSCGVQGVMREWITEQCAKHCIALAETRLDRQAILEADGLFFCNALIRVWPVQNIENRRYDVGIVHRLFRGFDSSELGVAL